MATVVGGLRFSRVSPFCVIHCSNAPVYVWSQDLFIYKPCPLLDIERVWF